VRHLKSILLILSLFFIYINCNAQDTIYLKSGEKIEAKIIEVNINLIKYKKISNLQGPLFEIHKDDIQLLLYENGESENFNTSNNSNQYIRSEEAKLTKNSNVFLDYITTNDKKNVDDEDAEGMLRSYIDGKTILNVVSKKDEADFLIELYVIKKAMGKRKAQIKIINLFSNELIYESKWKSGSSSAWSGYSGSRAAIGNVVKKDLVKKFPEIER